MEEGSENSDDCYVGRMSINAQERLPGMPALFGQVT